MIELRGVVYNDNRNGPRTEPCGTQNNNLHNSERVEPLFTAWTCAVRYEMSHFRTAKQLRLTKKLNLRPQCVQRNYTWALSGFFTKKPTPPPMPLNRCLWIKSQLSKVNHLCQNNEHDLIDLALSTPSAIRPGFRETSPPSINNSIRPLAFT